MEVKRSEAWTWTSTAQPGVETALLRRHEAGGGTYLLRLAAGARVPRHLHLGAEEIFVLSGQVMIGQTPLKAQDYYFAHGGEMHEVTAQEQALLLCVAYGAITVMPETIEV